MLHINSSTNVGLFLHMLARNYGINAGLTLMAILYSVPPCARCMHKPDDVP